MKKIIIHLFLTFSFLSFADSDGPSNSAVSSFSQNFSTTSYCPYQQEDDENITQLVLGIDEGDDGLKIIEDYQGNEINGLKKGKRTFVIFTRLANAFFQEDYAYYSGKDGSTPNWGGTNTVSLITQDEDIKDQIINSQSFCTYGSEIIKYHNLNLSNENRFRNMVNTMEVPEGADYHESLGLMYAAYQVVDNVISLKCRRPLVYTEWRIKHSSVKRPRFMGEKIHANCSFK